MFVVVVSFLALLTALCAAGRAVRDHFTIEMRLKEFERQAKEARHLLYERGLLANELAHEIKNPITAILCSADALDHLIGKSLHADHRKCLKYIKEYGDSLLRLVSDFLDLSRLESGQLQKIPEKFSIADVVESTVGLLQAYAQPKNISIKSYVVGQELVADADPRQVKQVLFNLIHNAIKFTKASGEIQVMAESDFPHHMLRISVKDNGCGMQPDELAHIFEPYVQADSSPMVKQHVGTGLGLAVCKALIELNGGQISVHSSVGVGSCFAFTVPGCEVEADMELAGVSDYLETHPRPLEGQRVLLVDDDSGARDSVAHLIEAWGGLVDQVAQASEAVKALQQQEYDAVMIDNTIDGVYGHELARALSGDLCGKSTKLIVAARNEQERELARSSGADSCVGKPLNGKLLLESLIRPGRNTITH